MALLIDAFWRAAAYCLHPRVIALSLLPLLVMGGAALALGWFFWVDAVDAVRATIESWSIAAALLDWLDGVGLAGMRMAVAPLVVVFLATPIIVVLSLLIVAVLMVPAIVGLVSRRRFADLERKHGGSVVAGAAAALGATLLALLALVVSLPLWLVPPLALVLPALIWGWLTCRVMTYDVLAEHASADERRQLATAHRGPLLLIGITAGALGAAPSLVWAAGALSVVLAPVLVPLAVWIYTLVFAFAALWFAHYLLAALRALRAAPPPQPPAAAVPAPAIGEAPPALPPPPP
jgi:hypothetical protein